MNRREQSLGLDALLWEQQEKRKGHAVAHMSRLLTIFFLVVFDILIFAFYVCVARWPVESNNTLHVTLPSNVDGVLFENKM